MPLKEAMKQGVSRTHFYRLRHQHGPYAVHKINHAQFNAVFGVDLLADAERLWSESNG